MLAIFQKQVAHAPQELNSPRSGGASSNNKPRNPDEILRDFHAAHPTDAFSTSFGGGAALACVGPTSASASSGGYQRMFCGLDDIYCVFLGRLDNLSGLIRQYGLCGRSTNEALLVIEAYRTLRDRGPYPADQVVKDLAGAFAFVVFDNRSGAVFAALGGNDGGDSVPLYWGVAADGSAVISDDRDVVKRGCGKSYAPFPAGCMFHSEGGLKSFEHPMNRLKAMPRVDSEGAMCGATFKVDTFTKINSMPRVGSATNWAATWDDAI
ncbi:stem-specific protein TSJT1-like [Miscanthus floridulus]|uniref:stem-specific protein TSJT1-like n=1 Tax=Miscanthus floridulus TaxID=154761 RepID=UPI00345B091E